MRFILDRFEGYAEFAEVRQILQLSRTYGTVKSLQRNLY